MSGDRGPGRPRVLSQAEVVDAALRVARENGVARLSMRAVARELDVPPMTIYGYVPNKEALDALIVDRILSDVRVPEPHEGSWDQRLAALLCDARRTLVDRPPLAEGRTDLDGSAVQLLHQGAFGPEASRLADGVLDLLREGGVPETRLQDCFVVLFTYVTGHIGTPEITLASDGGEAPADASSADAANQRVFEFGVQALIAGLGVAVQSERLPA